MLLSILVACVCLRPQSSACCKANRSTALIDFRGRIRVDFVDSAGAEMGIDGGGLFRELMTEYVLPSLFSFLPASCWSFLTTHRVMEKGFHPDTGLFSQCSAGTLYPNPSSLRIGDDDHVKHTLANYHFLGRMLVRCLPFQPGVLLLTYCRASHSWIRSSSTSLLPPSSFPSS